MSKQDVVASQKIAIALGQEAVLEAGLGACYDQGLADAPVGVGGISQEQADAMVASAVAVALVESNAKLAELQSLFDADEVADAAELQSAKEQLQGQIAALQVSLDEMTAKEALEAQAVANVQASIEQVQSAFDAIKALLLPKGV